MDENYKKIIHVMGNILLFIIIIVAFIYSLKITNTLSDTLIGHPKSHLEQCLDDDYTVYLDGEKTDPDTIDIKLYKKYSINDEKKSIYVVKQIETDDHYIPICIPITW